MVNSNLVAFLVTLGAGLATAVGGAAVRFGSLQSPQFLSLSMALAAGVMLHVSYVEILEKSISAFKDAWPATLRDPNGPKRAVLLGNVMLFIGVLAIYLLDKTVDYFQSRALGEDAAHDHHAPPSQLAKEQSRTRHRSSMIAPDVLASYMASNVEGNNNRASISSVSDKPDLELGVGKPAGSLSEEEKKKLLRTSIVTAIAISAHNLPEGLATFIAMSSGTGSGLPLAVAIMIHNIPEGVCVAVPILYATGSRMKAFLIALVAGLSEPVGAAFGWLLVRSINPSHLDVLYGSLFGIVAGLMIYIALVELIPSAITYYPSHPGRVSLAVFAGIGIMALSLVAFEFSD